MNKLINVNDKIEDCYGEWHTVASIDDNSIVTTEGKNIHTSKVMTVLTPDDYGYYEDEEDIPDCFGFTHSFTDIG